MLRKRIVVLIGVLTISIGALLNVSTVGAVSPWDDVLQTTQSLAIGTDDHTSTYLDYMHDNCDSFYYNSLLSTASDPNGKIAVVQQHVTDTINIVSIEWTASSAATTTFLADSPSSGNYSVGVSSASYHVDLWNTPGFQKCYSGNGASAIFSTTEPGWDFKIYFSTYPVSYPSGYVGVSVPTGSGGAVTGDVQCASTNISSIRIDAQSGVSGNAVLTDNGVGGKQYRYYLWEESPYSLVVLCDGDAFYGPTISTNLYNYYYWVCAPTTPGQSPNLNICT